MLTPLLDFANKFLNS
uniref:Uncharacterized protein n=1 Tax=Rhizophora mucronata TaxID=61149 RepID=A0A2P2K6D2_RHIMU